MGTLDGSTLKIKYEGKTNCLQRVGFFVGLEVGLTLGLPMDFPFEKHIGFVV